MPLYRVTRNENRAPYRRVYGDYYKMGDVIEVADIWDVDIDGEVVSETPNPKSPDYGYLLPNALEPYTEPDTEVYTSDKAAGAPMLTGIEALKVALSLHDIRGQQAEYIIRDWFKIAEVLA